MKTLVILFGTGELPKTIWSYLTYAARGQYEVIAFTCDAEYIPETGRFMDLPVVAFEKPRLDNFIGDAPVKFCLPVGYRQMNRLKERKYFQAKEWGYDFISYVHPTVNLFPDSKIGENVIILENNTVQPGVTIGNSCVIWSNNHIGHGSRIGSCSWLASGIIISGGCTIGERVFMGVNSCLRDGIEIADDTLIGMGAVITKSTESASVYLAGANRKYTGKKSDEVEI